MYQLSVVSCQLSVKASYRNNSPHPGIVRRGWVTQPLQGGLLPKPS